MTHSRPLRPCYRKRLLFLAGSRVTFNISLYWSDGEWSIYVLTLTAFTVCSFRHLTYTRFEGLLQEEEEIMYRSHN